MAHFHILVGTEAIDAPPVVRHISFADLKDALVKGTQDFMAMPSHALFLCLIYPLVGILLGALTFGYGLMSLLYPLAVVRAAPAAASGLPPPPCDRDASSCVQAPA